MTDCGRNIPIDAMTTSFNDYGKIQLIETPSSLRKTASQKLILPSRTI